MIVSAVILCPALPFCISDVIKRRAFVAKSIKHVTSQLSLSLSLSLYRARARERGGGGGEGGFSGKERTNNVEASKAQNRS